MHREVEALYSHLHLAYAADKIINFHRFVIIDFISFCRKEGASNR